MRRTVTYVNADFTVSLYFTWNMFSKYKYTNGALANESRNYIRHIAIRTALAGRNITAIR